MAQVLKERVTQSGYVIFWAGAEWLSLKVLQACGFAVENIITIPYVNENLYENNIFAGAIKWEL